jgi:hypothetical protein
LGDRRNAGERSCNSGDGKGQMAQPLMFMIMIIMIIIIIIIIVKHNEFAVKILERAMFGKVAVGRPGLQYLQQATRITGADSYTAMKRMACNHSRWKAANE